MGGRIAEGGRQIAVGAPETADTLSLDRVATPGGSAAIGVSQTLDAAADGALAKRTRKGVRAVLVDITAPAQTVGAGAAAVAPVPALAVIAGHQATVRAQVAQSLALVVAAARPGALHATVNRVVTHRTRGRTIGVRQAFDARAARLVAVEAGQRTGAIGRALPVALVEPQLPPAGRGNQEQTDRPSRRQRGASASASARAKPPGKRRR